MIRQYPRRSKFKKTTHKHLPITEFKTKNTTLNRGAFGIKALISGILSFEQIEIARRKIVKGQREKMKTWIRIALNIPITSKPREMRMGKGKGDVKGWVTKIRAGQILFEIYGHFSKHITTKNLIDAIKTLPIPCILVKRITGHALR